MTERITLSHGNGGRRMRELIEQVFKRHLSRDALDIDADAVRLPDVDGELVITTDGYTVQPLEFPGGDIGSLAVHGTVNDLAVAGAEPRYLTLNAFIEEGLPVVTLERLVTSMAVAARECGVHVLAGDTKVLPRGQGDGLYLATTGVGVRRHGLTLGVAGIRPGDAVLVSGPVGDHGVAVMLAREQFGLSGELQSDAASVLPLTRAALAVDGIRFMRDPTRGGLATVLNDVVRGTGLGVRLRASDIPVRPAVTAVCDMLGYDPYYLACEGRVIAVVAPEQASALLSQWQSLETGAEAALIGHVTAAVPRVVLETPLGGERLLEELGDDPLPRIC